MSLKTKKGINSPLAKKTLFKMGVRIAAVITLAALASYYHIFSILNDQVRDSLKKYIAERGQKESAIFLNAQRNHEEFKQTFLGVWQQRQDENNQAQFDRLFVKKNDGTRRLHIDAFNGIKRHDGTLSRYISGFVGRNAPNTTSFQNKLLFSYEIIDHYADAWTMDYANLYVSMPENVNLVYWPGVLWGVQADPVLDVNTEEWVYVANRENNPERKLAWTGLYYDQTADEWMVSLATPVDFQSEHLINIGHDILLNTLFGRVFNDRLEGTFNFIFREDGRIIAHPDLVDVLRSHKGVLHATDTNNSSLLNMIELITVEKETIDTHGTIFEDEQSDALLAVSRISGPDWLFVTVFPKSLLASVAMQTAYIVSVIGLISLIVELIILFFVLKSQILEPVNSFGRFLKDIARHNFSAINTLINSSVHQRQDEIGSLANSMIKMAGTIRQHEEKLKNLVDQRTQELDRTNKVLLKESKERKEMVALLQTIAKNVSGLQGDIYFNTLSSFLANVLEGDLVIIGRLSEDKKEIYALSVMQDKKHIDDVTYLLADTPCEKVIHEGPQIYNGNAQEEFPKDKKLFEKGLHSYIGTPLLDSKGENIGHLAVMKRGTFEENDKVQMIIDSVSSRAANELVRQVNEEIITLQAKTDPLTNLPNRNLLIDRLSQAILQANRQQDQLALIFIDFDHFKLVNDQLGHAAGDELLKVFSQRFIQCVRQEDTVARLGGDEFVVLLKDTNIYGAEKVSRNIQKILGQEITIANTTLTVSCSMGIAIYPDDGADEEILIKHADMAMYSAKELGRNNFQFFTHAMNIRMKKSMQIEYDLRQAISKNEFELYYQPIVCVKDSQIYKMEALIRWHHPDKGLVISGEFIPVAEHTGQIIAIGEYVLEQACKDFNVLKVSYPYLESIAINFSPRQFRDKQFTKTVAGITQRHGILNECIEIEITESLFIEKEDNTILATLDKLKALGFKVSLDDFGTGYSSLSYLKQLSIDTLKIDRSFIQDLVIDKEALALVTSIINLAHNFKLSVVAEGVQDQTQESILKEYGCDFVQGFYYSPAVSKDALIAKANDLGYQLLD